MQAAAPTLSVVVPVRNEAPNIRPVVEEIAAALAGLDYELIFVDDGSDDATLPILQQLALEVPNLRLRRLRSGCGKSAAILVGVRAAAGEWIATIDGDGQNDPVDVRRMLAEAQADNGAGPILIAGRRTARRDTRIKRLSSRVANRVRAGLLGDATPDTACGLKLFRREVFLELPHFDNMHRFLPALFIRAGGRVRSLPVTDRPRLRGKSKYGTFDRLAVGIVDLAGVAWLQRRWHRPDVETL